MIYEKITNWRQIPGFATHPIWKTSFAWLETKAAHAAEGSHELGHPGFVARVMSYPLKSRAQATFELHRHTIDIQFTIVGGEGIELAGVETLQPLGDYSESGEVEHFLTPASTQARINNLEGWFTVLFAGEPHMPQLEIPNFSKIRKVVIKIPSLLVSDSH